MTSLIVSLHDVAPATSELGRRWLDHLETMGVKASLLVVPGFWKSRHLHDNQNFIDWLHAAELNGHEIVQHGLHHERMQKAVNPQAINTSVGRRISGKILARGCEEFWELSYEEATERLKEGKKLLGEIGCEAEGFVAPGWLLSEDAKRAVSGLGYRYTTTHTKIIDFHKNVSHKVLALSLRPTKYASSASAITMSNISKWSISRDKHIRIALHPEDLLHEKLRKTGLATCLQTLNSGYISQTYKDFLVTEYDEIAFDSRKN